MKKNYFSSRFSFSFFTLNYFPLPLFPLLLLQPTCSSFFSSSVCLKCLMTQNASIASRVFACSQCPKSKTTFSKNLRIKTDRSCTFILLFFLLVLLLQFLPLAPICKLMHHHPLIFLLVEANDCMYAENATWRTLISIISRMYGAATKNVGKDTQKKWFRKRKLQNGRIYFLVPC